MKQTKKIRWLIAHEPVDLFLRTAKAFQEKIAELTNNEFEVEIFTPSEYTKQYGSTDVMNDHRADPMVSMDEDNLEMSQMHVTELARYHSPDFYALELPFLFRDHDHASRVLEGEIGKSLLNNLTDNSPATGLAFTYSGGFRCIVSEEKITSLDDLGGLTYAVATNPISIDTVESVGAIPKVFHIRDFRITANKVEGQETKALETTIPRYLAQFAGTNKKYLLNTKHSLFLTSIIIQNKFWQSLDSETQAKFNEACLYASRLERKWSVEDAENFANKSNHSDIGVEYAELGEAEVEKFKEITQPLYDKYRNFFTPDLVDGIIKS